MITYTAIFAGKTKDGEAIFLYRDNVNQHLHIKRDAEPLQALSPDAKFEYHVDKVNNSVHLSLISPQWSGKAMATFFDMVAEEGFYLPEAHSENHIVRGTE